MSIIEETIITGPIDENVTIIKTLRDANGRLSGRVEELERELATYKEYLEPEEGISPAGHVDACRRNLTSLGPSAKLVFDRVLEIEWETGGMTTLRELLFDKYQRPQYAELEGVDVYDPVVFVWKKLRNAEDEAK